MSRHEARRHAVGPESRVEWVRRVHLGEHERAHRLRETPNRDVFRSLPARGGFLQGFLRRTYRGSQIEHRRTDTPTLRLGAASRTSALAYADLRQHWLNLSRWHLKYVRVGKTAWASPSLTVNIAPELGLLMADGRVAAVKLWLREPEPTADAIRAMHRLLSMHMDAIYTDAVPLVIDVRREHAHVLGRRRLKKGFDDMLRSEAVSMGTLWSSLAKTA